MLVEHEVEYMKHGYIRVTMVGMARAHEGVASDGEKKLKER